ncbi:DNA/RNA non-specific endonuclease [Roseomonas nepalensis]|uniref:Endonuclease n=1 Tax=Muricoccus nepalensis TaxID=1854500 RepID=A0A502FSI8_9PROT|nr:DNA/RNA non-specific endonuclease [Roseomonas nepalensis]TPG52488.1 DNA/RNA non-specific endonuclease [Roseomonas nepalensis]
MIIRHAGRAHRPGFRSPGHGTPLPAVRWGLRGGLTPSGLLVACGLLLSPLAGLPSAEAATSACPEHHPGGAAPDILRPSLAARTRELCFEGYAVLHSGVSRAALAAAEHLTRRRILAARQQAREDAFHAEDRLPEEERARLADYARSGFDRGHMAPSGDMPTLSAQAESFSLANMVPQNPGSNRCLWEGIESTVRELAVDTGEVWVLTGPIFEGQDLQRLNGRVLVPTSLYKAVYLPARGEAGAYVAPNGPGLAWRAVSLEGLRELAGLDAFPTLPASVRARAMSLPEPRPSNVRGSCNNQPGVVTSRPSAPPPDPGSSPEPSPPATSWWPEGKLAVVVAGVFAVAMVIAFLRVLGRR